MRGRPARRLRDRRRRGLLRGPTLLNRDTEKPYRAEINDRAARAQAMLLRQPFAIARFCEWRERAWNRHSDFGRDRPAHFARAQLGCRSVHCVSPLFSRTALLRRARDTVHATRLRRRASSASGRYTSGARAARGEQRRNRHPARRFRAILPWRRGSLYPRETCIIAGGARRVPRREPEMGVCHDERSKNVARARACGPAARTASPKGE